MPNKKDNELMVVMSNSLVQNKQPDNSTVAAKLSYNLDIYQQKIISILIAHILKNDTEFAPLTLSFKEFCNLAGISHGGKTYKLLWESLNKLAGATFSIRETKIDKNGKEKHTTRICHWIETIIIHEEENVVDVKLDSSLKPYLLCLDEQKKYFAYELGCMLMFRKKWSGLLYQWLKSHQGHGKIQIGVDELKGKLMSEKDMYKNTKDFCVCVLNPAIDEINKYTDIDVSYEKVEKKTDNNAGRAKVVNFAFDIRKKNKEKFIDTKSLYWNNE